MTRKRKSEQRKKRKLIELEKRQELQKEELNKQEGAGAESTSYSSDKAIAAILDKTD